MSSLKIMTAVFIFFAVGACSLFQPFVDRRRNAGVQDMSRLYVGRSKPQAPAICYNKLWTDEAQVQKMADAECQKQGTGSHAEKTSESSLTCKVFLPTHAYFKCVK